jgi:hypothetical protein
LDAGKQGIFCPKEGLPPLAPKAPKKPRKPPVSPPVDDSEPNDGYFKEDAWKPEEERESDWTKSGEQWKDDENDEDLQTS